MNQSLLTQMEYDKCAKIYGTYCVTCRKAADENPPPCWKMGETYSKEEIKMINDRLKIALRMVNVEDIKNVWEQIKLHDHMIIK